MRKAIILTLSLIIVLVGISVINKKLHFSSKINELTGEVAGIFLASKFLDNLIPDTISAAVSSPYQDVQGNVSISGNVGIGTTSPTAPLQISGNSTNKINLLITNTNATVKTAEISLSSGGTNGWALSTDYNRNGGDNFVIWGGGAGAARLFINSNGNVGIGTNDPAYPLHVSKIETGTSGTIQQAADIYHQISPTGNSTLETKALEAYAQSPSSNIYNIGKMTGLGGSAEHYGSGTFTDIRGTYGWAYNKIGSSGNSVYGVGAWSQTDAGTVNNIKGLDAWSGVYGGTVNKQYGITSWVSKGVSGTVNTRYNLYLGADGTATNDYGIYQATASQKNYFAGYVGIGTGAVNPTYNLQVSGSAWVSSGSWSGSDARWKQNIQPISNALDKIQQINGVSFNWNKAGYPSLNFDDQRHLGLVAQDVEKVLPELVTTGSDGYKGIDYNGFIGLMVNAIKQQQVQIKNLQAENASLKLQLEALESRLKTLEAKVQ